MTFSALSGVGATTNASQPHLTEPWYNIKTSFLKRVFLKFSFLAHFTKASVTADLPGSDYT